MSTDRRVQKDLIRLTKSSEKTVKVENKRGVNRPIASTTAVGSAASYFPFSISSADLIQVISIFSSLLVTEEGPFEKPPGWPIDGSFSLGGTVDTTLQYYEQRRVHVVEYYDVSEATLKTVSMLVDYAPPFSGFASGVLTSEAFMPPLEIISYIPPSIAGLAGADLITDRVAYYVDTFGVTPA